MIRNRIVRYSVALALLAGVGGMILLSRLHLETEATAHSQQTKKVTQWEYCFVSAPYSYQTATNWKVTVSYGGAQQMEDTDRTGVSALNKLGADGWEVVGVSDKDPNQGQAQATTFILKRPKM